MKTFLSKQFPALLLSLLLLLTMVTGCDTSGDTSDVDSSATSADESEEPGSNIEDEESMDGTTTSNENVTSETEGTGDGNTATTSSSKVVNTTKPGTATIDLKGKEILIVSVVDGAFGLWSEEVDTEDETKAQKVLREWREKFEKTYKCKLKLKLVAANDTQNQMIVKMLGGNKFADIINAQRLDFERIRLAGDLLTDLNKVPYIDLKGEGVDQGVNELYNYDNKQLAMYINLGSNVQNGFLVNNTLLKKLKGVKDPYQLAKEGKWTFTEFFALVKAATVDNGDGQWGLADQYGLAWNQINTVAFFKAAGVNIFTKNASGKVTYTMNSQKFRTTADLFIKNLVNTNVILPSGQITMALKQFCSGKVLLLAQPSYHSTAILAATDQVELGWLPIPTENGGKNYVNIADGWSGAQMIPAANKDLSTAGLVLSEYAKTYNDYQKAVRDDYQNVTFVNCSECWDLFDYALTHSTGDVYFPEMGQQVPWDIMWKVQTGDVDYINNLESFEPEVQAWVDDIYNK